MRPAFPSLLTASVVLPALWGCGPRTERGGTATIDAPIVVVVFDAGRPANPSARSSGVRLAVWEDGTVLVAADPLHPERDMRVGQLAPDQLTAALSDLDQAGFFAQPATFLVAPDSDHLRVAARSKGTEQTHSLDRYHQLHADWWPPVIAALEQLRPPKTWPVADAATDGEFRGYILAEWWRTPWAR
ncbi:MAG: hypothetical protein ACKVU4_10505 [Phycisphaerales bacterium]